MMSWANASNLVLHTTEAKANAVLFAHISLMHPYQPIGLSGPLFSYLLPASCMTFPSKALALSICTCFGN
jgi:hypothetical protein